MVEKTVTITHTNTVSGNVQVPPLASGRLQSTESFNQHVAASLTDQATSKMFNEQSFGR